MLVDGSKLNQTGSFYLATRSFATDHGDFAAGAAHLSEADALTRSQRQQYRSAGTGDGLPKPVIASYLDHRPPTTITPVSAHTAQAQQQTADLFYANHLMPVKVTIADRIWQPQPARP